MALIQSYFHEAFISCYQVFICIMGTVNGPYLVLPTLVLRMVRASVTAASSLVRGLAPNRQKGFVDDRGSGGHNYLCGSVASGLLARASGSGLRHRHRVEQLGTGI